VILIFIIGLLSILNIEFYCVETHSSENTKIYPSEDISAEFVDLSAFAFVLQNLPPEIIVKRVYKLEDVSALLPKIKTKPQDSEWDNKEKPYSKNLFKVLGIILSISSVVIFLLAVGLIFDFFRERNFWDLLTGIGLLIIPGIAIVFFVFIPFPTSCVIYFDNASSDSYDVLVKNAQSFKIQPNAHIRKVINLGWSRDIEKIDLSLNLKKTIFEKKEIILVVDDDGKYLFNIDKLNSYYIETADYITR